MEHFSLDTKISDLPSAAKEALANAIYHNIVQQWDGTGDLNEFVFQKLGELARAFDEQ